MLGGSNNNALNLSTIEITTSEKTNTVDPSIKDKLNSTVQTSETVDREEFSTSTGSNLHFIIESVPRYYTPFEEIPFLYFIDGNNSKYIAQEKYYFSLLMGSTLYHAHYALVLKLASGNYTVQIGRAYNATWVADAIDENGNPVELNIE
ncbi:unnamed protein product, partial [Didymodactylos carnosus]